MTKVNPNEVKPDMDCETCWFIVHELGENFACDECIADAEEEIANNE